MPNLSSWRANAPRALLTIASTFLFSTALRRLPFAEALALSYLGPLLVAPLAAAIQEERLRADVLGGGAAGHGWDGSDRPGGRCRRPTG